MVFWPPRFQKLSHDSSGRFSYNSNSVTQQAFWSKKRTNPAFFDVISLTTWAQTLLLHAFLIERYCIVFPHTDHLHIDMRATPPDSYPIHHHTITMQITARHNTTRHTTHLLSTLFAPLPFLTTHSATLRPSTLPCVALVMCGLLFPWRHLVRTSMSLPKPYTEEEVSIVPQWLQLV